jgi:hypothetical protein
MKMKNNYPRRAPNNERMGHDNLYGTIRTWVDLLSEETEKGIGINELYEINSL